MNVPAALAAVAEEARGCRACPLWEHATQTVFGEGPDGAEVMLVGEQPGDQEDRQGRPFIGPAGRLLDDALAMAGVDRQRIYVTNAVKHFKWTPRGKRRIHAKPNVGEVLSCKPWLDEELAALHPDVVVLLGATAVRAVLGPGRTVGGLRGRDLEAIAVGFRQLSPRVQVRRRRGGGSGGGAAAWPGSATPASGTRP